MFVFTCEFGILFSNSDTSDTFVVYNGVSNLEESYTWGSSIDVLYIWLLIIDVVYPSVGLLIGSFNNVLEFVI